MLQPRAQHRSIVVEDRFQIRPQISVLGGIVLKGEKHGMIGHQEIERSVIIELEDQAVVDREPVARFGEGRQGDGVVVDVALPLQVMGGRNRQRGRFDADVVSFAGTQQQLVRQQGQGFSEWLRRDMLYLQAAHRDRSRARGRVEVRSTFCALS